MDYEIIQMDAQTWRIENSGVRMSLMRSGRPMVRCRLHRRFCRS